ncbi:hypothetical protein [Streptomyces sp. NPDC058045]|uniref:hypothetical protein n=1 Tax=Streptomyces sp. NPDC058045 TaxID=3346311 RepID=UPI0036E12DE1
MTNPEAEPPLDLGELRLRAENSAGGVGKRTARWAVIVLAAGALLVFALLEAADARPGDGWRPSSLLVLVAGLALLWGVFGLFDLISPWWHVGWAIEVFDGGLVESRFGEVRSVLPFRGGVLLDGGRAFVSPRPTRGPGRFTLAHHRGERASEVFNAVRTAAEEALVEEALESLRAGHTVDFPRTRGRSAGLSVTAHGLRLDDGREFAYPALELRLSHVTDGARRPTEVPERASLLEVRTDDRTLLEIPQHGPNATVLREILRALTAG